MLEHFKKQVGQKSVYPKCDTAGLGTFKVASLRVFRLLRVIPAGKNLKSGLENFLRGSLELKIWGSVVLMRATKPVNMSF